MTRPLSKPYVKLSLHTARTKSKYFIFEYYNLAGACSELLFVYDVQYNKFYIAESVSDFFCLSFSSDNPILLNMLTRFLDLSHMMYFYTLSRLTDGTRSIDLNVALPSFTA